MATPVAPPESAPPRDFSRLTVGGFLAAWAVVALRASWMDAIEASAAADVVATAGGWIAWTAVTIAVLVPSPASLTIARCTVPLSVVVGVVTADPVSAGAGALAVVLVASATFCDAMVQGGAYGAETRFCLRTPVPQMAPALVAWLLLAGTLVPGSLLVAAGEWAPGVPLLAAGVALAALVPRRLHRLSRRWFVVVPAGVVIHDHLVLAETIMARRHDLAALSLTRTPGEEADFTGGVAGTRVVVALRTADKVVLSDLTARMLGTTGALHVTSFAVAPRRPARAVAALGVQPSTTPPPSTNSSPSS